jgi:hypothetical protein
MKIAERRWILRLLWQRIQFALISPGGVSPFLCVFFSPFSFNLPATNQKNTSLTCHYLTPSSTHHLKSTFSSFSKSFQASGLLLDSFTPALLTSHKANPVQPHIFPPLKRVQAGNEAEL